MCIRDSYEAMYRKHMAQEETEVLPKAREVLTEQDWDEVAAAFAENKDPLQGQEATRSEWFREFYRRIVTLVPEPWGVGARR